MIHYLLVNLKRALLNVWRNRRRSGITVFMIVIGTTAVIILGGYLRIMEIGLRDNAINNQYGHFQVARKGYFEADQTNRDLMMPGSVADGLKSFLENDRAVDLVNERLFLTGLVGNATVSTYFAATCGDPEAESLMLPSLEDGKLLSAADPYGVIIGRKLAERLGAAIDSPLTLMLATEEGAQEAISVRVRGIYHGLLKEQEQLVIYMPLQAAQELSLEAKVHSLIVMLKNAGDLDRVMSLARRYIADNALDLEVRPWDQLAVYFKQVMSLLGGLALFAGAIVFIVIVFGISNTMYIAVNERTREIGTTRALGDGRGDVLVSFLLEGFCLGLLGAIIGTLLSTAAIPVINALQISLPPGPGQDDPIPVHILIDGFFIRAAFALDIVTAVVASLLPAFNAARKRIAEALRQS